jgi:hypothetical protein
MISLLLGRSKKHRMITLVARIDFVLPPDLIIVLLIITMYECCSPMEAQNYHCTFKFSKTYYPVICPKGMFFLAARFIFL